MATTYRLNANELSLDVMNAIRLAFKDKDIVINVSETFDETEYLLSSPANKERLLTSLQQLKSVESDEMTIDELQKKFGA